MEKKRKRSNHLKLPHDEKDSFVARVILGTLALGMAQSKENDFWSSLISR